MVSGVGLVRARRDGVVVAVVVLPGVAAVPSAISVLTALVSVDVAVLSSVESAAVFVLLPSSALSVSLLVASACACCSAVS